MKPAILGFELKKWKAYLRLVKGRGPRHSVKRIMSKSLPNILIKVPGLIMYPEEILMEPTNFCNLKCPLCSNKTMKRKRGFMTFWQFRKIIDEIDIPLKRIIFGITGEPLMNKDLFKMVKYVSQKGIKAIIQSNGVLLDKFDTDEILDSGLTAISIAIDGATKETYEKYRIGGDFDRLVRGVAGVCQAKRERHTENPKIILQFLVMKHNEHEIEKMKRLTKEVIKPDFLRFKTLALWTNLTDEDRGKLAGKWLPKNKNYTRFDKDYKIIGGPKTCPFTFDNTFILWNGDVAICCADFEGDYVVGNVFREPFKKIFRNEKYMKIRKKILNKQLPICKGCDLTDEEHTGEIIEYKNL